MTKVIIAIKATKLTTCTVSKCVVGCVKQGKPPESLSVGQVFGVDGSCSQAVRAVGYSFGFLPSFMPSARAACSRAATVVSMRVVSRCNYVKV